MKEYINFDDEEVWEEEDENIYSDYPEDFKQFLIKHGVLEEFHDNFSDGKKWRIDYHGQSYDTIEKYFENCTKCSWIMNAFLWGDTQDWMSIDTEWVALYLKKNL